MRRIQKRKRSLSAIIEKFFFSLVVLGNIDHNSTSHTTKQSFHGTSISVFQYSENVNEKSFKFEYSEKKPRNFSRVKHPDNNKNILPTKDGKPTPLDCEIASKSFPDKYQLSQVKLVG